MEINLALIVRVLLILFVALSLFSEERPFKKIVIFAVMPLVAPFIFHKLGDDTQTGNLLFALFIAYGFHIGVSRNPVKLDYSLFIPLSLGVVLEIIFLEASLRLLAFYILIFLGTYLISRLFRKSLSV